ncbi:S-layer family protein [Pelomonas sp. KK5]|uniref:beta strand repeat-containing protein n=1 Tax=Pelomonas sp. KK5 TaxID=1855730 RepID=UPI001180E7B8|nr:Ig-like domain-containing protein [Pelomonas sp. KK5]
MSNLVVMGRRAVQGLLALALAGVLTACGGGSNAGTSVFTPGDSASSPAKPTATANDLVVVLDKSSITNIDTGGVTVTATAVDANRNVVSGVGVSFSVDRGIATPAGTVTDTSGQLKAVVTLGNSTTNGKVTITVVSGSITRSVSFDVVDPPASATTPTAARITVALDRSNVGNAGGTPVNVTVTAVTATNNVLAGIPVTLAIDNNGTITSGGSTNASGVVTAVATIGADKSNRLITITATSGTLVQTASFQVTGAQLQGQAVPSVLTAGSTGNQVQYTLTDVNKNPMPGVAISVSGPGVPTATGVTDINGAYPYTYTAPATAGAILITATAGGAKSETTVTVPSSTSSVPDATPAVSSATLSAAPNVVAVNSTGTANLAAISALFLGANNAPVKNVRVRFDLNGDSNSIGGTLGSGTSIVYSDANGNVATTYSPGTRSSPVNGVTIRACWSLTDFAAGACPNQALTTLTVVSEPVSITIGENETVGFSNNNLNLVKSFGLLVVNTAGNPQANVQITPSIDLISYNKGFYTWDAANSIWVQTITATCLNEDLNRNGAIDSGEDINGNAQLDPRKSDVSISMSGSTVTDANGSAILVIQYLKDKATWVNYRITAAAGGVLSPPAYSPSPTAVATLPADATSIVTHVPAPAYRISPYGQSTSCTDSN